MIEPASLSKYISSDLSGVMRNGGCVESLSGGISESPEVIFTGTKSADALI